MAEKGTLELDIPLTDVEKQAGQLRVCVTGATGYIAAHIIHRLLAAGHIVHATCRHPEESSTWQHLHHMPGGKDRLRMFRANLLDWGAFDEPVAGCDVIIHTAMPYMVDFEPAQGRQLIIEPALQGTENVLDAANKWPSVRKVVLTSSSCAVFTDPHERGRDHIFTEEDWNLTADEHSKAYFFAKRESEKLAYKMCQLQNRWQLASINPPAVWGPSLTPRADSESVRQLLLLMRGKMWIFGPPIGMGFTDVRDVALAHCLAAVQDEAQGRFFLNAKALYPMLFAAKVLEQRHPRKYWLPWLAAPKWACVAFGPHLGLPAYVTHAMYGRRPQISTKRAETILGLKKYIDPERTVIDMAEALINFCMIG